MPGDKKFTRSALKSAEEKVLEETASVARERTAAFVTEKDMLFSEDFLTRFVDLVSAKINKNFKILISSIEARQKEVEDKLSTLEHENSHLKEQLDKHEQYSRRNNIRIYGISVSNNNENVDEIAVIFFSEKLKVQVSIGAIDRSHRLRSYSNKPSAIIVKFATYRTRAAVLNNKKLLKGSGITLAEDLTATRASLSKICIEKWGYRNVWTRDGIIMVKIGDTVRKIESESQLLQLS